MDSTSKYLVSALVPIYSAERFMRGLLEDLEAQTIADRLEIVIVDTDSPQNEQEIVKEFQRCYENIVYVRTSKRENSHTAANLCIKAAQGKYLTAACSDDRHLPCALEVEAMALNMFPDVGLVYPDIWGTKIENDVLDLNDTERLNLYNYPDFSLLNAMTGSNFSPQPMWRKCVQDVVGLFDDSYAVAGDYDLFYRISRQFGALHIRAPLGLYYENPNGVEKSQPDVTRKEFSLLRRKVYSETSLEAFFPLLSDYPGDAPARAACLWELGNNCMKASMNPEYGLALGYYGQAHDILGDLPELLHNMALAQIGAGGVEKGIKLLDDLSGILPQTRESCRAIKSAGDLNHLPDGQYHFFVAKHPVVAPERKGRGVDIDELIAR